MVLLLGFGRSWVLLLNHLNDKRIQSSLVKPFFSRHVFKVSLSMALGIWQLNFFITFLYLLDPVCNNLILKLGNRNDVITQDLQLSSALWLSGKLLQKYGVKWS